MKRKYLIILIIPLLISNISGAQVKTGPSLKDTIRLNDVEINALRSITPMKELPAAISVVNERLINKMSKTIAADEVLRLVPGVRIDNGTGGSRVHLYVRGQGVLSETGFRGVQILIDGIPVNDPGGFCPDIYDVDWATVKNVEIVKGLAASLYGGSANGGVVNIITQDGGDKPVNATLYTMGGSYGFWKSLAQIDGRKDHVDYRISYSHTQGDGYRIHQAFMGENFSEKLNWKPTDKIKITQLLSYTSYFNQNSEGINRARYDTVGHQAANTDAIPFNEFHLTKRLTGGLSGNYNFCKNQDATVRAFFRANEYKETSNRGDDNKPFNSMGFSAQYNLHLGKEKVKNHLSLGADYQTMVLREYQFAPDANQIDPDRVDSHWSQVTFDSDIINVNQRIRQRGAGFYLIDKLDLFKKLYATLNVRYDYFYNELTNSIPLPDSLQPSSGRKEYGIPTFRFGLAYDVAEYFNIFANAGTGFLVPSGNELYNNPDHWGGFNSRIKPSYSQGAEIGVRGEIAKKFHYDVTCFNINSQWEFYRYSIKDRGETTPFYGNVGESNRFGIETYLSYIPVKNLILDVAYTYSSFKYTKPVKIKGHFIPQCPQHMVSAEISYKFLKHLTVTANAEYQSKWYIQVADSVYEHFSERGVIRDSWVPGFKIFGLGLNYEWKLGKLNGELAFFVKNLFDEQYFGFTEPNDPPDYNSYQPAPGREFFGSLKLKI